MILRAVTLYYVLLLLIGCSLGPGTPEDLMVYVKRFEHECARLVTVRVSFADLRNRAAAICKVRPGADIRRIYVDYATWQEYSDLAREQLLFHELGHCVLERYEHDDVMIQHNGTLMPRSIMYPVIFGYSRVYAENREYYIRELCGR